MPILLVLKLYIKDLETQSGGEKHLKTLEKSAARGAGF
jgi:hypothetical protein